LKAKGLEEMNSLKLAMIPVVKEMAMQKHWGRMPLPELVDALKAKTNGSVLQSDEPKPAAIPPNFTVSEGDSRLYFEVEL
jgi:hypothetical protein